MLYFKKMLRPEITRGKIFKIALTFFAVIFPFLALPDRILFAASGQNLIRNADLSQVDQNGIPLNWSKGRWGQNSAAFVFPAQGQNGQNAFSVTISERSSGDAKWFFQDVPVTSGKQYQYSDIFTADVPTFITAQYKMSNGSYIYKDIANPAAQNIFQPISVKFVAPEGAVSVTIFHLINTNGTLVTSDFFLSEIEPISPSPQPDNLISNPSFEITDANGKPVSWFTGRWGQNSTSFVFPVNGRSGENAAKVEISSRTSGDAKWYGKEISVTGGKKYEYSDYYRSSTLSYTTIEFKLSDGRLIYQDLGLAVDQAPDWTQFKSSFTTPSNAVSMKIFHLIKSVGWLEIDDVSLTLGTSDPNTLSEGMVSINFDDGWYSQYQYALPILDSAGLKSDFFIVSDRIADGFTAYVKIPQILEMQNNGHEIGAHTVSHADLTTLTQEAARQEILQSKNDLASAGISNINYFAYPFGGYNDQVKDLVRSLGFLGARSSDGGYNGKNQDIYALRRVPMLSTTSFEQIKNYIDTAVNTKTWVILLFHEINLGGNLYSVTPETFSQTVTYLKQNNIPVVTLSEGLSRLASY